MRIELLNDDDIDVFVNKCYLDDDQMDDKEPLLLNIRDIITKIDQRYHLNLSGFYKIKAYVNKKVGLFLNIIKIDDNEFNNEVDFRIVLFKNEPFLLELDEYSDLDFNFSKKYYNDKFYVNIDDLGDYIKYSDMGNIVYGDYAKEVLARGKNIK